MTNQNFKILPFDPQTATDDFWDAILSFNETLILEVNPDDPLPIREDAKSNLRSPPPHHGKRILTLCADAPTKNIIGLGILGFETEQSPSFSVNGHIIRGRVAILPEFRRQGHGTLLLKHIVAIAKMMEKVTMDSITTIDAGREFCQRWNGIWAQNETENRLKWNQVDWELVTQWKTEFAKRNPNTSIEVFYEVSNQDIQALTDFKNEVLNQMPMGNLEDRFKNTPEARRISDQRRKDKQIELITMITREKDGTISGITERYYNPKHPHRLDIGLTGIQEGYRGRGLAKGLKAEMLTHNQKHYPTVQYEVTTNAYNNGPMLAINQQLGFRLHLMRTRYKFNIAELTETLH